MAVTVTVPEARAGPALATVTMNSLPSEPSTICLGTCKPDTSLIETSTKVPPLDVHGTGVSKPTGTGLVCMKSITARVSSAAWAKPPMLPPATDTPNTASRMGPYTIPNVGGSALI